MPAAPCAALCVCVLQERNSANIGQPVRLMERSVFSDRMVFVRAVKESGWMGDVELAVYDSWFGPILDSNPSLVPDGFIYLRCTPDTCMERYAHTGTEAVGPMLSPGQRHKPLAVTKV